MKTHMRKTTSRIVTIALVSVVSVVTVSTASAQMFDQVTNARRIIGDVRQKVEAKKEEIKIQVQGEFCGRFAETTGNIAEKMSGVRTKIDELKGNREATMEDRRDTRDENLNGIRSTQDARRVEWYAKLEARATTDRQKDAVREFEKTVDTSVETRRDAVDAAIAAFRSGVDSLVSGKKNSAETAADVFQGAVDAAVARAKADCEAGKDPETIRNTFRASLKKAKTELTASRKSVEGIGGQVDALAKVRNESIRKAVEAFDASLKAATEKLKTAFSDNG
ncbi:MAG: hypothetical protein HGB37_04470 [Candidatus Moranbacteria bacterium]|nr:hypothetical protein [Candidatus Moranbacteria bacterium]